jgi:hypothetical protein
MSGEEDLNRASSLSVARNNMEDEKASSWWNIWSKKTSRMVSSVPPNFFSIVKLFKVHLN